MTTPTDTDRGAQPMGEHATSDPQNSGRPPRRMTCLQCERPNVRYQLVDSGKFVRLTRHPRLGGDVWCNPPRLSIDAVHRLPTARELEIIRLVAEGNSTKQISELLGIRSATVETHIRSFYGRMGARTRSHAVALAIQRGFIELPGVTTTQTGWSE
jgi:DNA-binding CsgD family transcriptional regulator